MSTTIQTSKKTAQQLKELMKKTGADSYDEVIRKLISDQGQIPASLFRSNPKLKPFSQEDEAEFHEL